MFHVANRTKVGVLSSTIDLIHHFRNSLPENIRNIVAVLKSTACGQNYTFELSGDEVVSIGYEDFHDPDYDTSKRTSNILGQNRTVFDGTNQGLPFDLDYCRYYLEVYSSDAFASDYVSPLPIYVTVGVAFVFLFTIIMFFVYNRLVEIRQQKILNKAAHTSAIVSSLFPKQVRDRLLQDGDEENIANKNNKLGLKHSVKSYLSNNQNETKNARESAPIADLFPNCTVMFSDISGFTAWCSTRGPEHVFILLQTVYQRFDQIAKRRKVFKVETIGDSYLAVTGLPEPQENHALIMARFTWECRNAMIEVTRDLEVTLGPGSGELRMRFGLHSGPVTAGVLRGDRARFQLFGDTVNTAARMESTGIRDKIQISKTTFDILCLSGKQHWMRQREELVEAKGKGSLTTFWLNPTHSKQSSSYAKSETSGTESSRKDSVGLSMEEALVKRDRHVKWICEMLLTQINEMVACHDHENTYDDKLVYHQSISGQTCLDEVQEVIHMSHVKTSEKMNKLSIDSVIDAGVVEELHDYVLTIAAMYHDNPFHNFEHACHVAMSSSKLLKRIISPDLGDEVIERFKDDENSLYSHLHHSTYGIYSDPLAQFAIVFSALIHDVDHRGCSNARLLDEEPQLSARYRNQSTAEQNSFDLAWDLLMSDQFSKLRSRIFCTEINLLRFRQVVVNSVLATDIFDKKLNDLRKLRWEKAFSEHVDVADDKDDLDRKATVVIEHIIQASDVSHTMQHWQIYQKWNTKLFEEMYYAYQAGRMKMNPAEFWYQGEINFFDNYIIPLAKKLEDCGVFGVSSDEYLNYALNNRNEWEQRGKQIVEELVNNFV